MRASGVILAAAVCWPAFSAVSLAQDLSFLRLASAGEGQTKTLSPRDAGRRGGEAAGAALVCYGFRITDEVTELRSRYRGADLAEFDEQAGKILQAWQATKTCQNATGPNECKVSQQWSCLQALREIGPGGSAVPGLVEPK